MRKMVVFCVLMVCTAYVSVVFAGPFAPPVPWAKSHLEKTGKTAEELNARVEGNIPDEKDVGVPAYPDSFFYQSNKTSDGNISSVVLVSRDDPDTVRAWYEKHYSGPRKVAIRSFTLYEWMLQIQDLEGMKSEIWIDMK